MCHGSFFLGKVQPIRMSNHHLRYLPWPLLEYLLEKPVNINVSQNKYFRNWFFLSKMINYVNVETVEWIHLFHTNKTRIQKTLITWHHCLLSSAFSQFISILRELALVFFLKKKAFFILVFMYKIILSHLRWVLIYLPVVRFFLRVHMLDETVSANHLFIWRIKPLTCLWSKRLYLAAMRWRLRSTYCWFWHFRWRDYYHHLKWKGDGDLPLKTAKI